MLQVELGAARKGAVLGGAPIGSPAGLPRRPGLEEAAAQAEPARQSPAAPVLPGQRRRSRGSVST